MLLVPLSLFSPLALAAPTGGQVVGGSGTITQSGVTTTIHQSSQNLSVNWKTFNVTPSETVNFKQPNASSLAVNRIHDTNGSRIMGHLNANGQIYLINPNGILFGKGSQVNVGGLIASTLDTVDGSHFAGNGKGSIVNKGTINVSKYVALLGNSVTNSGVITARLGTVAMGAGDKVSLTFSGNNLVHLQVDRSVVDSLVANHGLIKADGGLVVMNAGARDTLLASVVNNDGVVEAQTVENHNGTITLLGGMQGGTVNVGGTLDASAPNGGNGGKVETSAHNVHVASDATITTQSTDGLNGSWLIDPVDFKIAASGGDITGSALGTMLASNSVTIQTTTGTNSATNLYGTSGTTGDINVSDNVSWSAGTTLTLDAAHDININAGYSVTATGNSAGVALNSGNNININGSITLSGNNVTVNVEPNGMGGYGTPSGSGNINLGSGGLVTVSGSNPTFTAMTQSFTVINNLGVAGSTTGTDLQGVNGNLSGKYVLGTNIDASATSSWNSGAGFTPIGNSTTRFTGVLEGLNHTITNLKIDRSSTDYVGLFGFADTGASIQDVGLIGGSVTGKNNVGELVGYNAGTVQQAFATGNVSGNGTSVGGLLGHNNYNSVTYVYATGNVAGNSSVGGLIGDSYAQVNNAYATGTVLGNTDVGGLIGYSNNYGNISNTYATGSVTGSTNVGGLVGRQFAGGSISTSYAIGSVSGGSAVGGLVGSNAGTVTNSYWDSSVNTTGIGSNTGTATGNSGLTTAQMHTASNFSSLTFTTTAGAANSWVIVDTDGTLNNNGGAVAGSTLPMLSSEYTTRPGNAHQLQLMEMAPTAIYTQDRNIDATATNGTASDVWLGGSFAPVGNSSSNFTGSFDGGSHVIGNLTINQSSLSGVGLFGYVGSGGSVTNLGLMGGTVSGASDVGGLVGVNYGTLSQDYNTGTVSLSGSRGGGLIGTNKAGGTLGNSYATGNITGSTNGIGGLVGLNSGSVSNAYATGIVHGLNQVGGLAGENGTGATITNVYATGSTSGGVYVGGLVGLVSGGTVTNGYWDSSVKGTGIGGSTGTVTGGGGLTTTQMHTASNFSGFTFTTTAGTTGNNWVIVNADGSLNSSGTSGGGTLPMLASEYSTTVSNAHQLQLMQMAPTTNYTQWQNIDATATNGTASDVWLGGTFVPIGTSTAQFTGNFDGRDHTISNLKINLSGNDFVGLFGYISGGTVENVGLPSVNVTGHNGVGGLVGENLGSVSNSYVTGSVTGNSSVGGLVGVNSSLGGGVANSYATDSVSATSYVGGLVGQNDKTISNSYSTGSVSGSVSVGGLVGTSSGSVSNSFWDTTTSGRSSSAGGTGMATADMMTQANFTSATAANGNVNPSWNFSNIWVMYDGHTYPLLSSFMTQLVVGASSVSQTYSGTVYNSGLSHPAYSVAGADTSGHLFNQTTPYGSNAVNVNTYSSNLYSDQQGYIINQSNVGSLTITKADLTLSGSRTYDGSTVVAGSVLTATGVNGETFSVTGSGDTTNLASKNVQTGSTLASLTGLTLGTSGNGGLSSNYNSLSTTGSSVSVTKANLTLSGSRTYDGTTVVAGSVLTATGVNGETFSVTGSGNATNLASKNVQTGSTLASLTGLTLGTSSNGGLSGNYNALSTTGSSVSVTKANLTLSGSKVYDGTTTLAGSALTATGVNGETFSVTGTGAGDLSSKNVQLNRTLANVTNLALGTSSNGGVSSNYNGLSTTGSSVSVTKANLTLSGSRTYDGTTVVAGSVLTATGVNGETFSVTGSGDTTNLASKNVQTGSTLASLTGLTLGTSSNGGLSSNYNTLSTTGSSVSVTKANLTLSGSRTYDGTTVVAGSVLTATGVNGETFSVTGSGDTTNLASKNVQTASTLASLTGLTLGTSSNGGLSGNYNALSTTGSSIDITTANLTLSGSRTYDGTTVVAGSVLTATGVNGETFSVTGSGDATNLASKNVQTGSTLASLTGLTLGTSSNGGLSGNYNALSTTGSSMSITAKPVTLTAPSVSKTYDGGLTYTTMASDLTSLSGSLVGGDTVTAATIAYTDKNVGAGNKTVHLNAATISDGNSGNNYSVTLAGNSGSTITAKGLTIGGITASNKVYDGTTSATVNTSGATYTGLVGGDAVTVSATGLFSNMNVGNGKTVTLTSSYTGADVGNYTITDQASTMANITPATLTYTATPVVSFTGIQVPSSSLSGTVTGFVSGDTRANATTGTLTWSTTATASSPVGQYPIDGSGLTANYGNYTFVQAAANATALTLETRASAVPPHYTDITAVAKFLRSLSQPLPVKLPPLRLGGSQGRQGSNGGTPGTPPVLLTIYLGNGSTINILQGGILLPGNSL